MANNRAPFSLNQQASYRQAIREYLGDLPILDRRVLQEHYSHKKDQTAIAREMSISRNHVERILNRSLDFTARLRVDEAIPPAFPVRTQSPIANW